MLGRGRLRRGVRRQLADRGSERGARLGGAAPGQRDQWAPGAAGRPKAGRAKRTASPGPAGPGCAGSCRAGGGHRRRRSGPGAPAGRSGSRRRGCWPEREPPARGAPAPGGRTAPGRAGAAAHPSGGVPGGRHARRPAGAVAQAFDQALRAVEAAHALGGAAGRRADEPRDGIDGSDAPAAVETLVVMPETVVHYGAWRDLASGRRWIRLCARRASTGSAACPGPRPGGRRARKERAADLGSGTAPIWSIPAAPW